MIVRFSLLKFDQSRKTQLTFYLFKVNNRKLEKGGKEV